MKKFLSYMAFAMLAVCSLAFVSCGDDDDDDATPQSGGSKIEINGVKYKVGGLVEAIGSWVRHPLGDEYSFCLLVMTLDNGDPNNQYAFTYYTPTMPKAGDVISSESNFTVTPYDVNSQINNKDFEYNSGSAKIVATNKKEWEITVQFNNLNMVYGSHSLTFNGTVVLPFNFEE